MSHWVVQIQKMMILELWESDITVAKLNITKLEGIHLFLSLTCRQLCREVHEEKCLVEDV